MFSNIEIRDLRGIHEGRLSGLSPISVLVGPNNCGKSTCLEAAFAVACGNSATTILSSLLTRGGAPTDAVSAIVRSGAAFARIVAQDSDRTLVCWLKIPPARTLTLVADARAQGLSESAVQFEVFTMQVGPGVAIPDLPSGQAGRTLLDSTGKWSTNTVDSAPVRVARAVLLKAVGDAHSLERSYSQILDARATDRVVQALARSFPGLQALLIKQTASGDFVLHTVAGESEAPVQAYLAGDGLKRFLHTAAGVYAARGGIVLIEEPEAFQHPRYLAELVDLLMLGADDGTQMMMSTHSLEVLDALLAHPSADKYVSVHRLRRNAGILVSTALSASLARSLRNELEEDLRS